MGQWLVTSRHTMRCTEWSPVQACPPESKEFQTSPTYSFWLVRKYFFKTGETFAFMKQWSLSDRHEFRFRLDSLQWQDFGENYFSHSYIFIVKSGYYILQGAHEGGDEIATRSSPKPDHCCLLSARHFLLPLNSRAVGCCSPGSPGFSDLPVQ